jgi:hypothetical protein
LNWVFHSKRSNSKFEAWKNSLKKVSTIFFVFWKLFCFLFLSSQVPRTHRVFQVFSSNVSMFLAHKVSQGLTRSQTCVQLWFYLGCFAGRLRFGSLIFVQICSGLKKLLSTALVQTLRVETAVTFSKKMATLWKSNATILYPTSLCGVLVFGSVSRPGLLRRLCASFAHIFHTQQSLPLIFHTQLCHTNFHPQLCHTNFHTQLCHRQSLSHKVFATQLCHTQSYTQLCNT